MRGSLARYEAYNRIRCSTYNVNDKLPPKGTTELASLVGDGSDDLLIFGFQEAGRSSWNEPC